MLKKNTVILFFVVLVLIICVVVFLVKPTKYLQINALRNIEERFVPEVRICEDYARKIYTEAILSYCNSNTLTIGVDEQGYIFCEGSDVLDVGIPFEDCMSKYPDYSTLQ